MFPSGIVPITGLLLTLVSSSLEVQAATGNTTKCADGAFDLYIQEVGETPCKTYERLRQICNTNYVVPNFPDTTPPDWCNEQVGDCCCNSAAWSLAMLCMNCQLGIVNNIGYDAGAGAYQIFLNGGRETGTCSPQVNGSLPDTVQLAVCNKQIKIPEFVYSNYWSNGDWFYVYSSGKLTANLNSGTAFEKCDYVDTTSSTFTEVTSSSTGTSSPSPSASGPASDSDSSSLSTGATAGIAVAAVVVGLAAIVGLVLFFLRRRKMKKANGPKGPIDGDWEHPSQEAFNPYIMADTSVGMASLVPVRPGGGASRPEPGVAGGSSFTSGQSKLERYRREDAAWNGGQEHSALGSGGEGGGASTYYPATSSNGSGSGSGSGANDPSQRSVPFRHADAGPVVPEESGEDDMELPPAYGEQMGGASGSSSSRPNA